MTNKMNTTLYVGVTSNLMYRVLQHKEGKGGVFTRKYKTTKLIYYEESSSIVAAIEREKELKEWSRRKKDLLIKMLNPLREDLYEELMGNG